MIEQKLALTDAAGGARVVHAARPGTLDAVLAKLPRAQADFATASGFSAKAEEVLLLPGEGGVDALFGLGEARGPSVWGALATRLPAGVWRLGEGVESTAEATLGFCLGAYRYAAFKQAKPRPVLVRPDGTTDAQREAQATWMVRDLVNTPANLLGPSELAAAAAELAGSFGATARLIEGEALARDYPTVFAVGNGSERKPVVAQFSWSGAGSSAPLVSLCGKGVVFDSGGYDLKPSAAMLRMKKDMGGAATMLGLARLIMAAQLPVRLEVAIGCVENSVSGRAMRPLDVVRTRRGLAVEIGNTDAEGRLVLCDLLAEASDRKPALLMNAATLTGAARVALGPDLPALFCNDDGWAQSLLGAGARVHDPLWRLPLWDGYDSWLDSPVADLNNVSAKPMAGAITAALFLRRFVAAEVAWAHLDLYAWNDSPRAGRPEGGEAMGMRAAFAAIAERFATG
ncbi:MAG: leucyl aminopeptidase family protein [Rhodospirillales bacterium]|nr:leucyl aminopeptidase family protein [Rhodospirillales bacterium]